MAAVLKVWHHSKSQLRQSMPIHLKNITAKFHADPIWNDGDLDFRWRADRNNNNYNNYNMKKNKMSSDMRSVPGRKRAHFTVTYTHISHVEVVKICFVEVGTSVGLKSDWRTIGYVGLRCIMDLKTRSQNRRERDATSIERVVEWTRALLSCRRQTPNWPMYRVAQKAVPPF